MNLPLPDLLLPGLLLIVLPYKVPDSVSLLMMGTSGDIFQLELKLDVIFPTGREAGNRLRCCSAAENTG